MNDPPESDPITLFSNIKNLGFSLPKLCCFFLRNPMLGKTSKGKAGQVQYLASVYMMFEVRSSLDRVTPRHYSTLPMKQSSIIFFIFYFFQISNNMT